MNSFALRLPIIRLIWISTSLRKLPRLLLCQGACLFKHIEPPIFARFHKTGWLCQGREWGVTEVGIMESNLPASPWGTIQLHLSHKREQKTRLLLSPSARRAIGVAQTPLWLRTKALYVGRGQWDCEAKKGFSLDLVLRLFLWQWVLRTKVDAAKLRLFRSLKMHFWST